MEIIGLSGFAGSGKDTAAQVLVEDFGFTQIAYADRLRDSLYALNPIVAHGWQVKGKDYPLEPVYLRNVIDRFGWQGYKNTLFYPEIRRLMQRMGTEAVRNTIGEDVWVHAALAEAEKHERVVISDPRFYNELDAIRHRGGRLWRIERPGVMAQSSHPSELEATGYPHFEYTLYNATTKEQFQTDVRDLYLRRPVRHGANEYVL